VYIYVCDLEAARICLFRGFGALEDFAPALTDLFRRRCAQILAAARSAQNLNSGLENRVSRTFITTEHERYRFEDYFFDTSSSTSLTRSRGATLVSAYRDRVLRSKLTGTSFVCTVLHTDEDLVCSGKGPRNTILKSFTLS